jgi:hypothetical protein
MEGMLASLLLAASAIGIGGSMQASYAHDRYCQQRRDALESGRRLMDEVTSLPLDPLATGQPSVSQFSSYSDNGVTSTTTMTASSTSGASSAGGASSTSSSSGSSSTLVGAVTSLVSSVLNGSSSGSSSSGSTTGGSSSTATASTGQITGASRTLSVERRSALGGPVVATGDIAVLTVQVTLPDQSTYQLKRLITSAEGSANASN